MDSTDIDNSLEYNMNRYEEGVDELGEFTTHPVDLFLGIYLFPLPFPISSRYKFRNVFSR